MDFDSSLFDGVLIRTLFHRCAQCFVDMILFDPASPSVKSYQLVEVVSGGRAPGKSSSLASPQILVIGRFHCFGAVRLEKVIFFWIALIYKTYVIFHYSFNRANAGCCFLLACCLLAACLLLACCLLAACLLLACCLLAACLLLACCCCCCCCLLLLLLLFPPPPAAAASSSSSCCCCRWCKHFAEKENNSLGRLVWRWREIRAGDASRERECLQKAELMKHSSGSGRWQRCATGFSDFNVVDMMMLPIAITWKSMFVRKQS